MYTILSVDDEPINQLIVEELLSAQFEVALLSSGEECLSQIVHIKPDLILMDVSMPGIDGYQTCRQLRNTPATRLIPIVFVSARSTLDDKLQAYEAGGQDYLTKPFKHAQLVGKIEQLIQSSMPTQTDHDQTGQPVQKPALARYIVNDEEAIKPLLSIISQSQSAEELGQALLSIAEQLGLEFIIQLRNNSERYNFSCQEDILPLELSLIEDTLEQDRICAFNSYMIITLPRVTLLINHMPTDDRNSYEALTALLDKISSKIEARMQTIYK